MSVMNRSFGPADAFIFFRAAISLTLKAGRLTLIRAGSCPDQLILSKARLLLSTNSLLAVLLLRYLSRL